MIRMAKKNPFVFTIGFNKQDPQHIRAAEILNKSDSKAQLIATAILQYTDSEDGPRIPGLDINAIQAVLESVVVRTLQQVLGRGEVYIDDLSMSSESVEDISENVQPLPQDDQLTQNIFDAMDSFKIL